MSDIKKTFHELALESILFKGRHDWYFCYLKSERIAHVLVLLAMKINHDHPEWFIQLVDEACTLPHSIAHFVAGEVDVQVLLADIFSLLSSVRLSATRGYISKETALLIANEYELIAEKVASGNRLSPFVSQQDFAVPNFLERQERPHPLAVSDIPETGVTHRVSEAKEAPKKQQKAPGTSPSPSDRTATILQYVKQNMGVSIKDIRAQVPGCSEKTIQRELTALIGQGLIKREGERRWSVYKPV
jgi:hypothetical protein